MYNNLLPMKSQAVLLIKILFKIIACNKHRKIPNEVY